MSIHRPCSDGYCQCGKVWIECETYLKACAEVMREQYKNGVNMDTRTQDEEEK